MLCNMISAIAIYRYSVSHYDTKNNERNVINVSVLEFLISVDNHAVSTKVESYKVTVESYS